MHQALLIQDILLIIFRYHSRFEKNNKAYLAALARTCRAFKEPALDLLWEVLPNLSPLARCLPEACRKSRKRYTFSRQLDESEWITLRGYTHRVRYIRSFLSSDGSLDPAAIRVVFTLAPLTDPLFPNLRSLRWHDFTILPIVHAIVPSLTTIYLDFRAYPTGKPPPMEFIDTIGERCQYLENFYVRHFPTGPFDTAISRQVCQWPHLRCLECLEVTWSTDSILHLTSASSLTNLTFTLSADPPTPVSHFGSILAFPNLSRMRIKSESLKCVTHLFSFVRLPRIAVLHVRFSNDAQKQDIQAYWATLEQACPYGTLDWLSLVYRAPSIEDTLDLEEQMQLQLTLDDLPFHKIFHGLHGIYIDLPWSVKLTDANILDLVYGSPDLCELAINPNWGWRLDGGGGITLDGLVELLRYCPSLGSLSLAIDTQTFTDIPPGLDVAFRPDALFDLVDSHISPEVALGLVLALTALKLEPSRTNADIYGTVNPEQAPLVPSLWTGVGRAM